MAESERPRRWTVERVDELLAELPPEPDPRAHAPDPAELSLVDAAAVLSEFDLETLRPLADDAPRVDSLRRVMERSMTVHDRDGGLHWRLRAAPRREALKRLGSREAILNACRHNAEHMESPLERTLWATLTNDLKPLHEQSRDELILTFEVAQWLRGIVPDTLDPEIVREALDRLWVLDPLQTLVGTHFRGRERELDRLREYVGVLPPGSRLRLLQRSTRGLLGRSERPPLVVIGRGGVGKSTLMAKFIVDHAAYVDDLSLAFAYVDFDRPGVHAAHPASILVEAGRQLAVQCAARDRVDWRQLYERSARQLAAEHEPAAGAAAVPEPGLGPDAEARLVRDFAIQLERSFGESIPFLLVLDTFEEVQYRSRTFVDVLWTFLDRLRDQIPTLRTVIAGRAPIEGRRTEELRLGMLDDEAARGFLEGHGVEADDARLIVSRLGGNPLTLKLAAEVLRRESTDGEMVSLRQRPEIVIALDHRTAQVDLYRRILRHIHDEDVRKLAHPGLALRRITPNAIRWVLAEPCGLHVDSDETAEKLFAALRREITLVRTAEDGALVHRSDLRRAMLPMLAETEPQAVREIHARAITYYAARDDVVDRAEEIYHRLIMGEDPKRVDERWDDAVKEHLLTAIDELPASGQTYLASRLGVEIDKRLWRAASQEDHERRVERQALDALAVGRLEGALKVLRSLPERSSGSRLYLLEAQALRALGRDAEALETIAVALDRVPARGAGITRLDLLMQAAQIERDGGHLAAAARRAQDAYHLASWLEDRPRMLDLGVWRMELWREQRERDRRGLGASIAEVERDLSRLGDEVLAANPARAHQLAGQHPATIVQVALVAGLPSLRPERVRRIVTQWNHELRGRLSEDPSAAEMLRAQDDVSPATAMQTLIGLLGRHRLTSRAARALATEIRWSVEQESAAR